MNTIKQSSFLLLLIALLFTACTNSKLPDDSLKNVPEGVSSVTAFNLNQLMAKTDYDYIKGLEFFEAGVKDIQEDKPALAAIMKNPFSSGVDLSKNAYFVLEVNNNLDNDKQFGAMVFSIADEGDFQAMLANLSDKAPTERADFKMLSIDNGSMVAWNNSFGMIGGGDSELDIESYVAGYFDSNRKTSVASNADLAKCLAKDYDIATWVNSNTIANNPQLKTAASFLGISTSSLMNNYLHSYFNFEKGAIVGNTKHLLQKELTNDLQLFFKDGIKKDLSKYIPGEDLAVAVAAALDSKGIYQIISEKAGGTTTVNAALKQYGFTSKDIADAFGGDLVVAVYSTDKEQSKVPTGLMTGTIGDRKLFNQFLDLGVQFEMLELVEDNVYRLKKGAGNLDNAFLHVSEDVFYVTNVSSMLEKVKNGGFSSSDRISSSVYDALTDNAIGGRFNFDALEHFENDFKDSPFTNAQMNAGLESSSLKVDFKNKDVNSLQSLFELLNKKYLESQDALQEVGSEINI